MAKAGTTHNDSYIIHPKQLDALVYHENPLHQPVLTVAFKKRYWEDFFDYTFSHIGEKVTIVLDDIVLHPHIEEPLYYRIQLGGEFKKNVRGKIDTLKLKIKKEGRAPNIDDQIEFLEKMLLKYHFDASIAKNLIRKYHALNTPKASKKCIALYEQIGQREIDIQSVYGEIFDCYTDLNKTKGALAFLASVKSSIPQENRYGFFEKRGLIYSKEGNIQKAKRDYQKAIALFKQKDFLKNMHLSDEDKKHFLMIQNSELRRLKQLLRDLDNNNSMTHKE